MSPGELCTRSRSDNDGQIVPLHSMLNSSVGPGDPPGSALARFLEMRGRRIVKGCGTLWYAVSGRFLMSLPYQSMLNPDPDELREMLRRAGAFGVRFPSVNWTGIASGLYLFHRRPYGVGSLHVK